MKYDERRLYKGIGILLMGLLLLLFSIWERTSTPGQHFGGVYGLLIGLVLSLEGLRRIKNSLSSKK